MATIRSLLLAAASVLLPGACLALPVEASAVVSAVAPDQTPREAAKAITAMSALEAAGSGEKILTANRLILQDAADRAQSFTLEGGQLISSDLDLDRLRDLASGWTHLEATLQARQTVLSALTQHLEVELAQAQSADALWQTTEQADLRANVPAATLDLVHAVIRADTEAIGRIHRAQSRASGIQEQIDQLLVQVRSEKQATNQAISGLVRHLLARTSAPLWQESDGPDGEQAAPPPQEANLWKNALLGYLGGHVEALTAQVVVFVLALGGMLALRRALGRWTQGDADLKRATPIFEVPLAAALAISFAAMAPVYHGAPPWFHALTGALALPPTVIILRRVLDARFYPELYSVVGFYFLEQCRHSFAGFPRQERWFLCAVTLTAVLITAQLARRGKAVLSPWTVRFYWLTAALLGVTLAANVLGYLRLGELLGTGISRSAYLALFLYALRRVLEGIVLIALRVPPLSELRIAKQYHESLRQDAVRWLHWVFVFLWIVLALNFLELLSPLYRSVRQALGYSVRIGVVDLSPGRVLSFALAVWLSFALSRLVRFILNEEVYHRFTLAPGLSYAISTILNYLILLVGSVVALGLLGVNLTKITILAGALSVGLGFGLQNVINNFVSGIILLFERPVRVGDVIQIGSDVGEVRRIGIRASIVRTRDGADIILPNGNLISNQVINWSYSDRRSSVEVTLSIVRGPDPHGVIELLLAAAGNTLKDSKPEVYVTNITAATVGFVVRAWTNYTGDHTQDHSNLSLALAEALAKANIPMTS